MKRDPALDSLLELDGLVIGGLADGHWVKLDARKVHPNPERPHGIRYSLTLHNASGKRVFGLDNAHGIDVKAGMRRVRKEAFDHQHRTSTDPGSDYEYRDAGKLIEDFWKQVDSILGEL